MKDSAPKPLDSPSGKAKCSICGKPRDPKYDPFCSRRCADVDLHRWLRGGYVIPGTASRDTETNEDDE